MGRDTRTVFGVLVVFVFSIIGLRAFAQSPGVAFLPHVVKPATPTATPSITPTPTIMPTSTPTLPPPTYNNCQADPNPSAAPNYPIKIVLVDKSAEFVQLQNTGTTTIDFTGWIMCSITGNQRHDGVIGTLVPGEIRSFPYTGPGSIWNNTTKDDGALYNENGQLVSYWNDPD